MTCSHDFDPGYALEKPPKTKMLKPEEFLSSNNSEWDSETRSGQDKAISKWNCLSVLSVGLPGSRILTLGQDKEYIG